MKTLILISALLIILFFLRRNIISMYNFVKDLLWMKKATKDTSLIKGLSFDLFCEQAFIIAKGKPDFYREMVCQLIKKLREENPHKIENYVKAEKLYNDYFKLDGAITDFNGLKERVENGEEIHLIKFRAEYPAKGKRYSEYHINGDYSHNGNVLKLTKWNEKYKWLESIETATGEYGGKVDEIDVTMYLFATEDQVNEDKARKIRREKVEKEIVAKQEEISALYTKKSKI